MLVDRCASENRPHRTGRALRSARRAAESCAESPASERDMQKETDWMATAGVAQRGGEWDEVVVVDPDQVIGLKKGNQLPREPVVDAQIARVFLPVVAREIVSIVKGRP